MSGKKSMTIFNAFDESSMMQLGRSTCKHIDAGCVVFLSGEPGAGKTTFVRGILNGFGYEGAVTSPTYTLVETYNPGGRVINHIDLYRISSPTELEMTGMRDIISETAISLIEWPAHGVGFLPCPDLEILIKYLDKGRRIEIETHSVHHCPGPRLK